MNVIKNFIKISVSRKKFGIVVSFVVSIGLFSLHAQLVGFFSGSV